MGKQRDTSTDTAPQATDATPTAEQVVQPVEQPPALDRFNTAPIGDDTVSNPVIINR